MNEHVTSPHPARHGSDPLTREGCPKGHDHASDASYGGHEHPYLRFGATILTSTVLMHALTYVTTYRVEHVMFSQTRVWMSLLMGSVMAVVMLAFMGAMYRDIARNVVVGAIAAVMAVAATWLIRTQATVDDVAWMEAMVPHHSIAILTSERARIDDPRVRALADGIIDTQRREIAQMQALIDDLKARNAD